VNNGWAAGSSGVIAHTTDGGTTWTTQSTSIYTHITGLSFLNSTTGWALCSRGSILKYTGTVLPVALTYFKGAPIPNTPNNRLSWQTASEENNHGFDVERSTNGSDWETIGFVTGNGTTTEVSDYEFVDNGNLRGFEDLQGLDCYYRLKQIDFDGNFEYSNIIQLETRSPQQATVNIFPNPATDYLTIEIDKPTTIQIINGNGQVFIEQQISQREQLDISKLPAGIYWLKTDDSISQPLVKV
jgi:hypothetical protein